MNGRDVALILAAVLSTGAAAAIGAAVRGWQALRGGVRAREREAITDLAKWRSEADDAREEAEQARRLAEADARYWQRMMWSYVRQLHRAGMDPSPDPDTLVPPSERPPTTLRVPTPTPDPRRRARRGPREE